MLISISIETKLEFQHGEFWEMMERRVVAGCVCVCLCGRGLHQDREGAAVGSLLTNHLITGACTAATSSLGRSAGQREIRENFRWACTASRDICIQKWKSCMKRKRERPREWGEKQTAAQQRMHTECMHACMDAISVAQCINQSALFNTDMAGGDTYQMNQCPSMSRRSDGVRSPWLLQNQAGRVNTFPESLESPRKAFNKGSRYLEGDWPKYLLSPSGLIWFVTEQL